MPTIRRHTPSGLHGARHRRRRFARNTPFVWNPLMRRFIPPLACSLLVTLAAAQAQESPPRTAQPQQPTAGQPASPSAEAIPGQPQPGAAGQNSQLYRQQVSYALGRNFAQNLRSAEIDCDLQWLMAGISDTMTAVQPKWTDEQLEAALQRFEQDMQQKMAARMEREAAKNEQEAAAFLAQNAKREGVQTTPSGLQYRVLRQGQGPSPTRSDTVRCNYRGMLLNGTEFDSSARHGGPVEFPVDRVIPGWTEALQKMRVGDKWQLFIPPNLAYGANPPGPPIEANSLLVFELELLEIVAR